MRSVVKLVAVGAIALVVASCCGCRKGGKSPSTLPLTETRWQMVQIEGRAIAAQEDKFTLSFDAEGRLAGRGDCNRLMGPYKLFGNGGMTLGPVASTRMACPDPQAESRFIEVLGTVDSYAIDGNILMLLKSGEAVLVFTGTKE